ncbi:nucleolar complex protein 14 [Malassezia vespertilionis]|uniref:nucleolar complex protein 14 n=1 Tax=Malassezia vespertilionis TaxID=2020962 RepID=UPI0024B1CC25|nr:nucleolar complex protein 14 [Malassezia vespertilionis]WFD05676.1 nucleolar complex protein 14 [Malassezia vespertilionis]
MGNKKGGSQLAQLRSGLREAGVSGNNTKKSKSNDQEPRAGPYRIQQRRKRLGALMDRLNSFDEKVTRQKSDVLGRNVKGAVGAPGTAKSAAIKQRQEKLLPELNARHHSSSFVDRRFGEHNPSMSLEDKMLQRFTRERQSRTGQTSLFDLIDEEESSLTHYGQHLSGLDEMPDVLRDDDDEDDRGHIDAEETNAKHFSGFDAGEKTRNKAEVMKDIIAKSKLAKYERQKVKDADTEMRMDLDDELGDIRSLLFDRTPSESTPAEEKSGEYDTFVRELAFERRARPQDRTKSEEELAEAQAKRLRDAENTRLRRMRGEEVSDDEEGAALEDDLDEERPVKRRATGNVEAQSVRSTFGLGGGLETRAAMDEDEDEEESDNEEDDKEEDDEEEDDEEEDVVLDDLADYEQLEEIGESADTPEDENDVMQERPFSKPSSDVSLLPYTFSIPTTHDDLLDILEEHQVQPSQLNTVVSRIRTLYAPNLAEENPGKLQLFLSCLVDHLLYRAAQTAKETFNDATSKAADELQALNDLVLHIAELANKYPLRAAEHFVAKLAMMQRNLTRGLSHGPLDVNSRTWPGVAELCFLRVAGLIWPTSDRWHPVATPLALLMGQYLAHARIRSLQDVAAALYLGSLVVSSQRESKRLVPEVMNVLYAITAMLLPKQRGKPPPAKAIAEEFGIPTPDVYASHTADLHLTGDAEPHEKLRLVEVLNIKERPTNQMRAQLLHITFALSERLATLYESSPAFIELFTPLTFLVEVGAALLHEIAPHIAVMASATASKLRKSLERAVVLRRALRLQAHRAVSIATYAPKFDQQGFDPKHATDPDTERAQGAKLRALLKKERKGAIRELRKDAQFLADTREKSRVEEDESYKRKIDKIVSGMQEERSEQKQHERAKALARKRAAAVADKFISVTGASAVDAQKYLRGHAYRLEPAIDAFFDAQSGTVRLSPQQEKAVVAELNGLFDQYRDEDSGPDTITVEGAMTMLSDLHIDPASVAVLPLSYYLGSPSLGHFTRKHYIEGWLRLGVGAAEQTVTQDEILAQQRQVIPRLMETFQQDGAVIHTRTNTTPSKRGLYTTVYDYTFIFARTEGQKNLALDVALTMWDLLIPYAPAYDETGARAGTGAPSYSAAQYALWKQFLTQASNVSIISKDTWTQFLEFTREVDPAFQEHDFDAAWPSIIDEFVAWARAHR